MTMAEINDIANLAHESLGDEFLDAQFNTAPTAIYYRFVHHLVKRMNPNLIVELGVETGRCTAHMAAAAPNARVLAVDSMPNESWLKPILERYPNIDFKKELSTTRWIVDGIEDHSVGLCSVDTDHCCYQAMHEYGVWFQKIKPGGVMLFDDITLCPDMEKAWATLEKISPHLERLSLSKLHWSGYGVILF